MKVFFLMAVLVAAPRAFAIDNPCVTKQKNAASFTLAQEIAVPVQGAEVVAFENGPWTEAMGNNSGSDSVTVRIGNRTNRGMTIKKFVVVAKQIGSSDDCNITKVAEAKDLEAADENPMGFVCQEKGKWINCMPAIGRPANKMCSKEFSDWHLKACGFRPNVAH